MNDGKCQNFAECNQIKEEEVNIDGVNIHYAITGNGDHALLLLPGMLGTVWIHFKSQIENLHNDKLTIIGWDPPGYGKSRPPNRTYPKNFHERDAILAFNLMKTLGYDKFSILGYSGGGVTCLVLAALYPENIKKMIAVGATPFITPGLQENLEEVRDINNWSEKERTATLAAHGEKYLKDTLNSCIDTYKYILEKNNGDVCKKYLSKIKCPTLIVYGENDKLIEKDCINYLLANIRNSKLVTFKNASHGPHLKYPDEFNALAYKFFVEEE